MAGPTDAKAAFVRGGVLTVVDGRGHVWTYDTSITVDAAGADIVAPADVAFAELANSSIMAVDAAGTTWLFDLNAGTWAKGGNLDERIEGEDKNSKEPWKRGHNVTVRVAEEELPPDPLPASRSSRSKKEKEEA